MKVSTISFTYLSFRNVGVNFAEGKRGALPLALEKEDM
jgi:hypothetical protein